MAGVYSCGELEARKNVASEFVEATAKNSLSNKYENRYMVVHSNNGEESECYYDTKDEAVQSMIDDYEDMCEWCKNTVVFKELKPMSAKFRTRTSIHTWEIEEV